MKYFSKNPEEWKKQEQEFLKKEKEKTQRSRKRGIMLLLINVAIVVIVFLGLKMYYSQFPSYGSSSRYQILIKTPDAYVSGTPLDVQVRLYNNNHQETTMKISNFSIIIFSPEGKDIYRFSQDEPIEAKFDAFSSRLLFRLLNEVELSSLVTGTYKVAVSLVADGQDIHSEKTFTVLECYDIALDGLLEFYEPGETMHIELRIVNNTASVKDLRITGFKFSVKHDDEILWQDEGVFNSVWEKVGVGDSVHLQKDIELKLNTPGAWALDVVVTVNGVDVSKSVPVVCISEPTADLKDVEVYTDIPNQFFVGDDIEFSVYLQNASNRDIYLKIEQMTISILPTPFSSERRRFRIWLQPFSRVEVFRFHPWNKQVISKAGSYKMNVFVKTISDEKFFETNIQVFQ